MAPEGDSTPVTYCGSCGRPLLDETALCPTCGVAGESEPPTPETEAERDGTAPSEIDPAMRVLAVLGGLGVFLLAIGLMARTSRAWGYGIGLLWAGSALIGLFVLWVLIRSAILSALLARDRRRRA